MEYESSMANNHDNQRTSRGNKSLNSSVRRQPQEKALAFKLSTLSGSLAQQIVGRGTSTNDHGTTALIYLLECTLYSNI